MKKYKAHLDQGAQACDYGIGCGEILIHLDADNMEDAIAELKRTIEEEYSCDEMSVETCVILEITNEVKIDLSGIYAEIEARENEEEAARKEKSERQQLERLQAKYNPV